MYKRGRKDSGGRKYGERREFIIRNTRHLDSSVTSKHVRALRCQLNMSSYSFFSNVFLNASVPFFQIAHP